MAAGYEPVRVDGTDDTYELRVPVQPAAALTAAAALPPHVLRVGAVSPGSYRFRGEPRVQILTCDAAARATARDRSPAPAHIAARNRS